MSCKFVLILRLFLMGLSVPLVQDGSVADFNIYNEPSQWCSSIIAHSYEPFMELEVGDYIGADKVYQVVSLQVVSYEDWFGGAYFKDSDLWLQTCVDGGVLQVHLVKVSD